MTIEELVIWFYCLDIPDVVLLLTACTVLFFWIQLKFGHQRIWRRLVTCLLVVLMAFIFKLTLGDRSEGSNFQISLIPFHSYREVWAGGNPELYRSNFMNAALFYPVGLLAASLLPKKWPGWCNCLLAALFLMGVSIGIEYVQYRYSLGRCEIDDVIHNTFGALVGSLSARWIPTVLTLFKEQLTSE